MERRILTLSTLNNSAGGISLLNNSRIVRLSELSLLLTFLLVLGFIGLTLFQQYQQSEQVAFPPLSLHTAKAPGGRDFAYIGQLDLFGKELVQVEQEKPAVAATIDATLTGLITHSNEKQSMAIIRFADSQKVLRVGDSIGNQQASIREIQPDRVIIMHRGQLEEMLLRPDDEMRIDTALASVRPNAVDSEKGDNSHSDTKALDEIIHLTRVREGEEVKGYRISSGRYREIFASSGLRESDIATEIDGFDLTDPDVAEEILEELSIMEKATLTVERSGQVYHIELSI